MTGALQVTFSWEAKSLFTSDRLRSLLQYLAQREPPLRFTCDKISLYRASEDLLHHPRQPLLLSGHAAAISFNVSTTAPYRASLAFDSDPSVLGLLGSDPGLSILGAGARMLGAELGSIDAALAPRSRVPGGRSGNAAWLVAAWGAAGRAAPQPGLVLVDEEWDGARVWLRRPLSQAFLMGVAQAALRGTSGESRFAGETRLEPILKEALSSLIWQTRILAMLAVVRRKLSQLGPAVFQVDIPETSVPGVTSDLRHELIALRKASLLLLSGVPIPPIEATAPSTRDGMQAHLLRVVAGEPVAFEEEFSTLVRSLVSQGAIA